MPGAEAKQEIGLVDFMRMRTTGEAKEDSVERNRQGSEREETGKARKAEQDVWAAEAESGEEEGGDR